MFMQVNISIRHVIFTEIMYVQTFVILATAGCVSAYLAMT
jgi:hypothetical protein